MDISDLSNVFYKSKFAFLSHPLMTTYYATKPYKLVQLFGQIHLES